MAPLCLSLIVQISKSWKVGSKPLQVDEYLGHIFDTNHTSSHNTEKFSAYSATNILGLGLCGPKTTLLYDSHKFLHATLLTGDPLPQGVHTINMVLYENACTTSVIWITNNEEPSFVSSLPCLYPQVTVFVSRK